LDEDLREAEVEQLVVDIDMPLLSETLAFTVQEMREAVCDFTDAEPDLADLAFQIKQVNDARRELKFIEDHLRDICARTMTMDSVYIEGVGQVERKRGSTNDKWDDDSVLKVLLARSRDERMVLDEETGEYESEASAFIRVLKECAHIDYFRVKALDEHGVKASDYRQRTIGEPTVVIRP